MSDDAGNTLETIAEIIGRALLPLAESLGSAEDTKILVSQLGWDLPSVPPTLAAMGDAANQLVTVLAGLDAARAALEDGSGTSDDVLAAIGQVLIALLAIVADIGRLPDALRGGELPAAYLAATDITDNIQQRLIEDLLDRTLERSNPFVHAVLVLLGFIEETAETADPAHFQPDFTLRTIQWQRIGQFLQDPLSVFRDVYGWGSPTLNTPRLFDALLGLSYFLMAPGEIRYPSPSLAQAVAPGSVAPADGPDPMLLLPLFAVGGFALDLTMIPMPKRTPAELQGLALSLLAEAMLTETLSIAPELSLSLDATVDLTTGVALVLRPDAPPGFVADLNGTPDASASGRAMVRLAYGDPKLAPIRLFSIPGGSRLEIAQIEIGAGADVNTQGQLDPRVEAKLSGGRFTLTTSEADGFLAKILPSDGVSLNFDFGVSWSQTEGLRFSGSASLETAFALNLTIGPFELDTVHLLLGADSTKIHTEVSLDGGGTVGPISASIARIGAALDLTFASGNLGPVDLSLSFKFPSGLGIGIDAGPISGGGFIYFDPPNGRYAGILALSVYSIQVKAICLIDTKLPNGQSGFSFLVIISVEFSPIQLGYGFTLNGVGGLCGINRDFVTDAIQAGLRNHSIDHLLFPKDPIHNAPAIISDLRTIFPPAEGRFVFGPMAEIGWGGGLNLVTAELGILLALPSPVVIAILGQLNVILPDPDAPVVELHLDVLGIIDFGKKLFSLDATLHDSRVVVFTLFGDMAMRLSWGDDPNFALSIGGLNPHFQPPDGFPQLRRLTIGLSESDDLRLTIQAYFAITSNTFQFGAKAELYAGAGSFNIYGWLGFDALFIFTPFSFLVDFTAGLALRSGSSTLMGISVDGSLSGPTPWHVDGEAHVSLLFFDVSVHVSETWGDSGQVQPPAVDAWAPLQEAIQNVHNWSGSLPAAIPSPVTLSTPKADGTGIYVDPNGVLTLRERVLPLNQTLTKFGEAVPGPQTTFTLDTVKLGSQTVGFSLVTDKFAPAQFEQMSDQDKLSRPSFDDGVAGFAVGDGQLSFGQQFGLDLQYADIYVDDEHEPPLKAKYRPGLAQQIAWAAGSGAAASGLKAAGYGKFAPPPTAPRLVTLGAEQFVVASLISLSQRTDITAPVSKGAAYRALAIHLASNPGDEGELDVVPLHELAA
jgi:hypothetical protein